jgi:hypothetical protein
VKIKFDADSARANSESEFIFGADFLRGLMLSLGFYLEIALRYQFQSATRICSATGQVRGGHAKCGHGAPCPYGRKS